MPHLHGKILVVDKKELVPLCFPSYDALRMKLKRYEEKEYGIKAIMRGGHGRKLLVIFDSLSKENQKKIGDPRVVKHPLEKLYVIDSEAVRFYENYQYPDGSYLKEETIEKCITNASVLTALVRLEALREQERVTKGGSLRGIIQTIFLDAKNFNKILEDTGQDKHSLNSNARRFKQQYKAFKTEGYIMLIKDAKGKTKQNARKIDTRVAQLLNNIFAGQEYKPNRTEVAKQYDTFLSGYLEITNQKTGEIYDPKEFPKLSDSAITHFLSTYESKVGTYAKRSGDRQKLIGDMVPYHTLEQPHFGGSMISIDDRQPPFYYNNKRDRMWWYLGIDLASECITAWAYGKTKEELIVNFYRQMVRNYHQWGLQLPDALECESSLNSSFKDSFLKNGQMFQNVKIHANRARSKRIEAYFKQIRYGQEKKQDGWVARPHAKSESNQASSEKTPVIPYEKLTQQCFNNIAEWNNSPNSQDKSISRFDYLMQRQHPDLKPTNYRGFMKYLGFLQKTSCKAGIMHLQYNEWLLGDHGAICTGEDLIRLLKLVEGKPVHIYWLDGNDGTVIKALVYNQEGRYICEALAKPVADRAPIEQTPQHQEARELMSRYENTVNSYMKLQKNSIDKVVTVDHSKGTISDSFKINGFEPYTPSTTTAECVGEIEENEELEYKPTSEKSINSWQDAFKY